ncbi:MAG: hypothetical protein J4G09_04080 [Proteobacteria bacterium]|nr:hypothetical protein [Pseudomonadota bacterium]
MDEEKVKEIVSNMLFFNGKKDVSIDEIALIQPGLARIMPEIADRTWKLYYTAKEGCWDYAIYQWKEAKKLFELGALVRPKHEEAIEEYLRDDWSKLEGPLRDQDFASFDKHFAEAIDSANAWHEQKDKGYIKWKLPDYPPPDLDLTHR